MTTFESLLDVCQIHCLSFIKDVTTIISLLSVSKLIRLLTLQNTKSIKYGKPVPCDFIANFSILRVPISTILSNQTDKDKIKKSLLSSDVILTNLSVIASIMDAHREVHHLLTRSLEAISIYDDEIINKEHLFTIYLSNNRVLLSMNYDHLNERLLIKRIELISLVVKSIGTCYIHAIEDNISVLPIYEGCFNGNVNIIFNEVIYQALSDSLNFTPNRGVSKGKRLKARIYQGIIKEIIELSLEKITFVIEGKIPDDIIIFMVEEFILMHTSYINYNTFIINCRSLMSMEKLTKLHETFQQYCDLDVTYDDVTNRQTITLKPLTSFDDMVTSYE